MEQNSLASNETFLSRIQKKLSEADDIAKIAEQNDLLYLTSNKDTAEQYSRQSEGVPDILTGGKPKGYKPCPEGETFKV